MIISRDAEATDKIQHILVIKILNKVGYRGKTPEYNNKGYI